ncbi:MAG: BON domain-containing protein [Thermoguttaceae bacterium]
MRQLFTGFVVAVSTTLIPMLVFADNQEVAERIAKSLYDSGRLQDYKIGVRYDDGTAWLEGRVASEQQMNTALQVVLRSAEVSRVVNRLEAVPVKTALQPINAALAPEKTRRILLAGNETLIAEKNGPTDRLERAIAGRLPTKRVPLAASRQLAYETGSRVAAGGMPGRPMPVAYMKLGPTGGVPGGPRPTYAAAVGGGSTAPARYDQPQMPNYAWPSYASHPNYAALTYPKQYSPTAWPFIGPFYPYPQVPLGWRKVSLEWDDGWWMLDFYDHHRCH